MAEKKRFKFQSASKIAKSINLSEYQDIVNFNSKDEDGSPRCFKVTLTNLLRVKDLLKFQSQLRELQRADLFFKDALDTENEDKTWKLYQKPLDVLINCSREASPSELDHLCRLLAAFFKDYGKNPSLKVPFEDLQEIIELNVNFNARPIFTFVLTYFKVQTSHVLENISSVIRDFLPWLSSRNQLVKRLSMESLGRLLRRAQTETIKEALSICIHTEGAEKILFSIIENIYGNFTSKVESLFRFLFEELIPNKMEESDQISENIRKTIQIMHAHSEEKKPDLIWLKNLYENKIKNISQNLCKIEFKASCIVLELSLEMLMTFEENRFTNLKKYPLVTEGEYFSIVLSNLVVPLLKFANFSQRKELFEDACSYLLRVVRSGTEATEALDREFSLFLNNVDHNLVGMSNINSFLSLFEWRLKTNDMTQVSHILLVLGRILKNKEIFHTLIVNPNIIKRIKECIETILSDLDHKIMREERFVELFGIAYGMSWINQVRIKLKAGTMENNDRLFGRLLRKVIEGFENGYDGRVLTKLYSMVYDLVSKKEQKKNLEELWEVAERVNLFENYFFLEFILKNYHEKVEALLGKVVESLPNENQKLRIAVIKLVKRYYESRSKEIVEWLNQFLELEELTNEVENSRKKCMSMERAVNGINMDSVKDKEWRLFLVLVKKLLMSQYFVKFSPLWESAFKSNQSLISKIKGHEKALKETWELYMGNVKRLSKSKEPRFINQLVESALNYKTEEKTDLVTIQFHLLRVVSEIISSGKEREPKMEELVEYTIEQFRKNTEYLKNTVMVLSNLIVKFNSEYSNELFDLCITGGLKSRDTKVRVGSLKIISKSHKIEEKRLLEMCSANIQQISSLTKTFEYSEANCESEEERKRMVLSIGIEVRLLAPRIYQHSNLSHGTKVIDYFLNFESKYVDMLFVELLPSQYSELFEKGEHGEEYSWVLKTMKFGGEPYVFNLPNVLTTVNLLVKRLANHLRTQATGIMEFCCLLLKENYEYQDSDSNILVERSFRIMVELVRIFTTTYFEQILIKYSEIIVELSKKQGLDFIVECTSQVEEVTNFCTRVVWNLFPSVFEGKMNQSQLEIANNIYNKYMNYVKKLKVEPDEKMVELIICSSETILGSMELLEKLDHELISAILRLDLRKDIKVKGLKLLLSSLPSKKALSKSVTFQKNNELELWKKILLAIDSSIGLLGSDEENEIEEVWDFVDTVLSLVRDNKCRKIASELLKKIPVEGKFRNDKMNLEEGLVYTGEKLSLMNEGSSEVSPDLDYNVEIITEIVDKLQEKKLSFRCINSILMHSLFMLWNNQKDTGIRRGVAILSFKVIQIVKLRLEECSGNDPESPRDPRYVLQKTMFPFLRRCLGWKAEDALVCLSLEILERYILEFSTVEGADKILEKIHGDLVREGKLAEVFHTMRELQKYKRCKGLKQLQNLAEQGRFSNSTVLKIIIPTCLQFLIQRNAVRHQGLAEMSKQCMITCCKRLPPPSFIKILKKLVQTYSLCKLSSILSIFAATTRERMASLRDFNEEQEGEEEQKGEKGFKDKLGVGLILSKLKKMSIVQGNTNAGEVPVMEVFECMGNLLNYYPESIVERELIKQCRILSKILGSRNREARRTARVSLINLAKAFKTRHIDTFIRELSSNMNRGYKRSVLIFTVYSILKKVLDDENVLRKTNYMNQLYSMILDEITRMQDSEEWKSKIDEARHPKSSQLMSLISQYATSEVVESNFTFLLSVLNGNLVSNKTEFLEYTDKFMRKVNELIVSATSGVILNNKADKVGICFKIFMTTFPKVRGIEKNIHQYPVEVVEAFRRYSANPEYRLKEKMEISKPKEKGDEEEEMNERTHQGKMKERYKIMPGASTGRSFESSLKKPGFESYIFSPLLVNSCIRLFNNIVSNTNLLSELKVTKNGRIDWSIDSEEIGCRELSKEAKYLLCEFSVLSSFLSEEVMLQKSSCSCLLKVCKFRPKIIEDFGIALASNVVERIGSLDLAGSEELAKDHIELIAIFFKNKYLDILYEAWDRSNRKGKLVECLLLQIETNFNRPKLHTSLLKLLLILIQTTIQNNQYTVNSSNINNMLNHTFKESKKVKENGIEQNGIEKGEQKDKMNGEVKTLNGTKEKVENDENLRVYFEKEFYKVTYEIMIRMLKGNVATRSLGIVARVIGYSFILLPMDEATRSKRFALILKHVNSDDPQVRLVTIKTLLVIMRELPSQIVWKRYAVLVVLAILPQLVAEDDPQSRKNLQILVTNIWNKGDKENKNELLEVVAHFSRKMKKHSNLAFSFFAYLCIKNENSLHHLNKLNLKVMTSYLEEINDDHWQNCYYWLMMLEQMLEVKYEITRDPASKIWNFVVDSGLGSKHTWVLSSSLRILSRVIKSKKIQTLVPNFSSRVFGLLKSSFRSLSTYSGSLERHRKLEQAILEAFVNCINVLTNSKDKALERLISKLCYVLRCNLGRKDECKNRIKVILEIFSSVVTNKFVYEKKNRVTLLKIIIAVFRVAHTKSPGVSHKRKRRREPDTSHADKATDILDHIESTFNSLDEATEYLKLLSFARNFVVKSRLAKKKHLALTMATNTKLAALRKLKKNKAKRRKFNR